MGPLAICLKKNVVGLRHVQVFFLFFAMMLSYMFRVNMSMAIVAMTDSSDENSFDWPIKTQGVILSSFMWGYIVMQFPGGELVNKFGAKSLVIMSNIVNSVMSIAIPIAAKLGGWKLVLACRIIQGVAQGTLIPCMHSFISKWAPLEERSRLGTFVYSGVQLGTAIQNIVSGYIIHNLGWPAVFYVNGIVGVVWVVLFAIFGANSPQESKWISKDEKLYIQTSLNEIGGGKKLKTPWKKIWSSMAFISLILANCGQSWGLWTMVTLIPSYLNQVQGVDIKTNGIMSAIPYLGKFLMSFFFGYGADLVIKKKWFNVTTTRKICNSIGFFVPGLGLIGLSYAPSDPILAVILLTVAVAPNAGHLGSELHLIESNLAVHLTNQESRLWRCLPPHRPSAVGDYPPTWGRPKSSSGNLICNYFQLGHIDMAPNFAGSMSGITNGFANTLSIFAPLAAGFILQDKTDPNDWQKVFYLSSGVYIASNIFYIIFGDSSRQSWNDPEIEDKDAEAHRKTKEKKADL
ncbi:hypothetical protein ACJJTC_005345 [Scirpophaga incertulas]